MIVWNIAYILYLFGNIAMLLFDFPGDAFSAIVFLPLLVSLWLAGMAWAIILPVKAFRKKSAVLVLDVSSAVLHHRNCGAALSALAVTYLERTTHLSRQPCPLPGSNKKSAQRNSDFANPRAHSHWFSARNFYADKI